MSEWITTYRDVEDKLAPQLKLDAWERVVYYHLLRHTRLESENTKLFSIDPLAAELRLSSTKVREVLRSLDRKGCTKNEVTRLGYKITVFLPNELSLSEQLNTTPDAAVDIETIDFYNDREYVASLLNREKGSCFYCLLKLTENDCELDHVVPLASSLDNTYKNIVACCHACNRKKGHQEATAFLRSLFRQGLLGEAELQERISAIENLKAGLLQPQLT
jgi:5-methylcytosine-specific restriction endonuclease McrA